MADRLALAERGQLVGEPRPVRQGQLGASSSSGTSTNRRELTSGGAASAAATVTAVAEQQQVDVDHARAVPDAARCPPDLALNRLAGVEQPLGVQRGADAQAGVIELALVRTRPTGSVS